MKRAKRQRGTNMAHTFSLVSRGTKFVKIGQIGENG